MVERQFAPLLSVEKKACLLVVWFEFFLYFRPRFNSVVVTLVCFINYKKRGKFHYSFLFSFFHFFLIFEISLVTLHDAMAISARIKITAIGIQLGLNTHHHDQLILSVSFRMMKIIVNTCRRFIPGIVCELLTPKGMSFGDTNTSSLFLLLPIIAF